MSGLGRGTPDLRRPAVRKRQSFASPVFGGGGPQGRRGEPQSSSHLISDLISSRWPVGLSPSAPFGGTSPVRRGRRTIAREDHPSTRCDEGRRPRLAARAVPAPLARPRPTRRRRPAPVRSAGPVAGRRSFSVVCAWPTLAWPASRSTRTVSSAASLSNGAVLPAFIRSVRAAAPMPSPSAARPCRRCARYRGISGRWRGSSRVDARRLR